MVAHRRMHADTSRQLAINIMAREWSNTLVAFSLDRSQEARQATQNGKEFMGRMDRTRVVLKKSFLEDG